MKALDFLTNDERAKIIHQLFPGEIRGLLGFSVQLAAKVINAAGELRKDWVNPLITADYWIYLAKNAQTIIQANESQLAKNSKTFAHLLFYDQLALFMGDCIGKYARFSSNPKFKAAAQLFFEFAPSEAGYSKIIYDLCLSHTAGFLFDAINEAMAQDSKAGLNPEAKGHISHSALAALAAHIVQQTDTLDSGGHWVDKQGNYKIHFEA